MPVTSAGRFLDEASSADVILVVNIVTYGEYTKGRSTKKTK